MLAPPQQFDHLALVQVVLVDVEIDVSIDASCEEHAPFGDARTGETLVDLHIASLSPVGTPGVPEEPVLETTFDSMSHK